MAVRDLLAHSPSRSLYEIGAYALIGRERQHLSDLLIPLAKDGGMADQLAKFGLTADSWILTVERPR